MKERKPSHSVYKEQILNLTLDWLPSNSSLCCFFIRRLGVSRPPKWGALGKGSSPAVTKTVLKEETRGVWVP